MTREPAVPKQMEQGGCCILEPDPSGHRMHYVRHLLAATEPGRCVLLTAAQAMSSQEYAAHASSLASSTAVLPDADDPRSLLALAVAWARDAGARRLIVPDGDKYVIPLLALMARHPRLPLEIRLLLMRTTAIRGPERLRPATLVKPALTQVLRLFRQVRVLFLTDALGVITRRPGYPGVLPVKDPVLRPQPQRAQKPEWLPARDSTTTSVGLFGVISARKNLPLLADAVSRIPHAVLIVAGRLEPDVRRFVDTSILARTLIGAGRMVVVDRHLGADELDGALASVDLVAVLHDNDSPSGILAEACIRDTPVLVPVGGWLARVVGATDVGICTPLTAHAIAEGIRRVRHERDRHVEAARRQAFSIDTIDFTDKLLRR